MMKLEECKTIPDVLKLVAAQRCSIADAEKQITKILWEAYDFVVKNA